MIEAGDALFISEVRGYELAQALTSLFGRSGSNGRTQWYGAKEAPDVELHFNGDGRITRALTVDKRVRSDVSSWVKQVLIDGEVRKTADIMMFASERVEGAWRGEFFAIEPVHPEAPRAEVSYAEHPFSLVVDYVGLTDPILDFGRQRQVATKIGRTLALLLKATLKWDQSWPSHAWALVGGPEPDSLRSEWRQLSYWPGKRRTDHAASDPPLLATVGWNEYYSKLDAHYGGGLLLPDDMDEFFRQVGHLSPADLVKYQMATAWFARVQRISTASASSAYVAAVSAIESLLDQSSTRCESCGQPIHSLTKKFCEFLEQYAGTSTAETRKKLWAVRYGIRSAIAHGSRMLTADLEPWRQSDMSQMPQGTDFLELGQLVRIAIINWLLSRDLGLRNDAFYPCAHDVSEAQLGGAERYHVQVDGPHTHSSFFTAATKLP